jgi:hypothetical protein
VPQGTTPVVAKLSRRESHLVKIEMDGYQPFEATLTRGVSGWVWGNIVFGGLIGLAVDAISGGMFKLTPEQITGTLAQKNMAHFQADGELYIVVVLDADPQWERIGTLNRAQ